MLPKHYNIMDLNRQCLGTIHVHCWVYHLHILHALIIFGINMKFDQYSRNICLMQASRGSNCWAHRAHPPSWTLLCIYNFVIILGPLHTQDWEPLTIITLQAISLVKKTEPVQLRFTLRLRAQRSMCMHDGCKVYMDSYVASNGSCELVTWTIFKNLLL